MNDTLEPWVIDEVARIWDEHSKPLKFRAFSVGKSGSKPKAAKRLSAVLYENVEWLGGSSKTDIEVLLDTFITKLIASLTYVEWEGIDKVNEHLERPLSIALGFWQFTRPDLKNIHWLACFHWGLDPVAQLEADKERRIGKAEILSEWRADLNEHMRRMAYMSGSDDASNARLKAALDEARKAMAEAEDEISRDIPSNDPAFRAYEADYIEAAPEDKALILKRWRNGWYRSQGESDMGP